MKTTIIITFLTVAVFIGCAVGQGTLTISWNDPTSLPNTNIFKPLVGWLVSWLGCARCYMYKKVDLIATQLWTQAKL
jgi:hypothetical protein